MDLTLSTRHGRSIADSGDSGSSKAGSGDSPRTARTDHWLSPDRSARTRGLAGGPMGLGMRPPSYVQLFIARGQATMARPTMGHPFQLQGAAMEFHFSTTAEAFRVAEPCSRCGRHRPQAGPSRPVLGGAMREIPWQVLGGK